MFLIPLLVSLDFLRSTGKIYVVFVVVFIVFLGLIGFLWYIERKINKLENNSNHE